MEEKKKSLGTAILYFEKKLFNPGNKYVSFFYKNTNSTATLRVPVSSNRNFGLLLITCPLVRLDWFQLLI